MWLSVFSCINNLNKSNDLISNIVTNLFIVFAPTDFSRKLTIMKYYLWLCNDCGLYLKGSPANVTETSDTHMCETNAKINIKDLQTALAKLLGTSSTSSSEDSRCHEVL